MRLENRINFFINKVELDNNALLLGSDYEFYFIIGGQTKAIDVTKTQDGINVNRQLVVTVFLPSLPAEVDLEATVREIDLLDDKGTFNSKISLDFSEATEQLILIQIKIKAHGREQVDSGVVMIHLEASVENGFRFVTDASPAGWLKVKDSSGNVILLPHYLMVQLNETLQSRDYFVIKEGEYEDTLASVMLKPDGSSHLDIALQHVVPARLTFMTRDNKLEISGVGQFAAIVDPNNPLQAGTYDLMIPDEPHNGGRVYMRRARHAKTWFKIGAIGDRYLHPGEMSAGCVTITDLLHWETIYDHLIKSRLSSKAVGTIRII